ncbi:MAG: hypothetical protein CM15mP66_04390 [Pseudomonadota bacterium]|nr:MAG: hypothetical protein CM15mP66_04390 [Pseudomonadota bacterium]
MYLGGGPLGVWGGDLSRGNKLLHPQSGLCKNLISNLADCHSNRFDMDTRVRLMSG